MRGPALTVLVFLLLAFASARAGGAPAGRVISLDYCADQYVLRLLPRAHIAGVSPDAGAAFSYMREAAAGLPRVRPIAEDVLLRRPDTVVRLYGGGRDLDRLMAKAGIRVVQIGYADTISEVRGVITTAAADLGEADAGAQIVQSMDDRLSGLSEEASHRRVLYVTPGGVTAGSGTLIDDLFHAAGLRNFEAQTGWRALPLERLVYEQPDLIAAAFFDSHSNNTNSWSATRNPIIRRQMADLPIVPIDGAWSACAAWFLVDIVAALSAAQTGSP